MCASTEIKSLLECKKKDKNTTFVDSNLPRYLPFSASKKRTKDYSIRKTFWGSGLEMEITALESINAYDLKVLLEILNIYQNYPQKWSYSKLVVEDHIIELAGIKLDIEEIIKKRGIKNKKVNRKTFVESLRRWYSAEVRYYANGQEIANTRYVWEVKPNKDYKTVIIAVNRKFLEFCIKKGILIDLKRLYLYDGLKEKYKSYAELLDFHLQGTKEETQIKGKKRYYYRRMFKEEDLFNALNLFEIEREKERRYILKKAFSLVHDVGKLPKYILTNKNGTPYWVRVDIQKVQPKIKKKKNTF